MEEMLYSIIKWDVVIKGKINNNSNKKNNFLLIKNNKR